MDEKKEELQSELNILRCKMGMAEFFELIDTFVNFRKYIYIRPDEKYIEKEGTDEFVRFIVSFSLKSSPEHLPVIILPNRILQSVETQIAHLKVIRALSYHNTLSDAGFNEKNPGETIVLEPTFSFIQIKKLITGEKYAAPVVLEEMSESEKNPINEKITKNYISKFEGMHRRLRIKVNYELLEQLKISDRSFFRQLLLDDLQYWKEKVDSVILVVENDHEEMDEIFLPTYIFILKWIMENKKHLVIENTAQTLIEKLESRKLIVSPYVSLNQ